MLFPLKAISAYSLRIFCSSFLPVLKMLSVTVERIKIKENPSLGDPERSASALMHNKLHGMAKLASFFVCKPLLI